jgi:hypothetical protein
MVALVNRFLVEIVAVVAAVLVPQEILAHLMETAVLVQRPLSLGLQPHMLVGVEVGVIKLRQEVVVLVVEVLALVFAIKMSAEPQEQPILVEAAAVEVVVLEEAQQVAPASSSSSTHFR